MKLTNCLTLTTLIFTLAACEEKPKPLGDTVKDKVDDALDRRPNEKLRDAGEDLRDAAKDAKDAVNDAVKK